MQELEAGASDPGGVETLSESAKVELGKQKPNWS